MPVVAADFGPLICETDLEMAAATTLVLWLPTYLAQAERERGLTNRTIARPVPRSFAAHIDEDTFLDERLPAVIIVAAQTADDPVMNMDGLYNATYRLTVTTVIRGRTPPETVAVNSLMGACVRRALLQHQSLGHFAEDLMWKGSEPQALSDPRGEGRFLAQMENRFDAALGNVVQAGTGPQIPNEPYDDPDPEGDPDAPYDPLAQVVDVLSTITGKSPGSP